MLDIDPQVALTIADMDDWKTYAYVVFFLLAGLTSLLGKLKRTRRDKEVQETGEQEPMVEAEILPEPETPQAPLPQVPARTVAADAFRMGQRPSIARPAAMTVQTVLSPRREPPPISLPRPVLPAPSMSSPRLHARAAYAKQVERPRTVVAKPVSVPDPVRHVGPASEMATVRRLISERSGQRAAFVLQELFAPPIALRDAHLDR